MKTNEAAHGGASKTQMTLGQLVAGAVSHQGPERHYQVQGQ